MTKEIPLRQRIEKTKNRTFSHDEFTIVNRVRQLDSDMNRHIARIMATNGHSYTIALTTLRALPADTRALALAGILQNIRFLAKHPVQIILTGCSRTEGSALLHALGASGQQVKQAQCMLPQER